MGRKKISEVPGTGRISWMSILMLHAVSVKQIWSKPDSQTNAKP